MGNCLKLFSKCRFGLFISKQPAFFHTKSCDDRSYPAMALLGEHLDNQAKINSELDRTNKGLLSRFAKTASFYHAIFFTVWYRFIFN